MAGFRGKVDGNEQQLVFQVVSLILSPWNILGKKIEIPLPYYDFCLFCFLFRRIMKILQSRKITTMNEDLMKIYFHWKKSVIFSPPIAMFVYQRIWMSFIHFTSLVTSLFSLLHMGYPILD